MKTRTEIYLEERTYELLKASNRAFNLMYRYFANESKYNKARVIYYSLEGKYYATCNALSMLRKDPVIKAWHMLGEDWLEALDELNVRPTF